ncbi:hypothetical protein [Longibaculum muris]|uniref:hypothetical protein n=1 Tax=Longibaculum muris TaxID=1796628 RepID=UPI003AB60723
MSKKEKIKLYNELVQKHRHKCKTQFYLNPYLMKNSSFVITDPSSHSATDLFSKLTLLNQMEVKDYDNPELFKTDEVTGFEV